MKYAQLLGVVLYASSAAVFAAPSTNRGLWTRSSLKHFRGNSHRPIPAKKRTGPESVNVKADPEYYNWSGAIQTAPSGENITQVQGTFTVPKPSVPSGQPAGSYSGAAWVGIDGTGGPSLWQAGALWQVDNSGGSPVYSYAVWYEWLPNALVTVNNFPVKAGDVISVNLKTTSKTTGTVVIADKTSGQSTTITTSAPAPTDSIIGQSAEWITEDLSSGGGLLPFANYHSVTYTGTSFSCQKGSASAATAQAVDLVNSSGQVISNGTVVNGNDISTVYV